MASIRVGWERRGVKQILEYLRMAGVGEGGQTGGKMGTRWMDQSHTNQAD